MTANNDSSEIETTASYLYDGGWRSTDRDLIIEEYSVTPEYADAICGELARIWEYEHEIAPELARIWEGSE